MRKFILSLSMVCAAVCSLFCTGCATGEYVAQRFVDYAQKAAEEAKEQARIPDDPDDAKAKGVEHGKMLYIIYTKVAKDQTPEFKAKVNDVWGEVNKINSFDMVGVVAPKLNALITKVISEKNFDDVTQEILIKSSSAAIKQVLTEVQTKTVAKVDKKYLYWLWGIREGVNLQITVAVNKEMKAVATSEEIKK